MKRFLLSILLVIFILSPALAADPTPPTLWQEWTFFDALLGARDRMARSQSDPNMIPVLKAIGAQAAQQVANLSQIAAYVKAQKDNLHYAFSQPDPASSLETIGSNFDTLAKGSDQIRNNLYYLTARCRMASSQALPDKEMYQASLQILGQIQQLQLQLNSLYLDAVESRKIVSDNDWGTDKYFRQRSDILLRSIVRIQDSVFSIYNSGYELTIRSR